MPCMTTTTRKHKKQRTEFDSAPYKGAHEVLSPELQQPATPDCWCFVLGSNLYKTNKTKTTCIPASECTSRWGTGPLWCTKRWRTSMCWSRKLEHAQPKLWNSKASTRSYELQVLGHPWWGRMFQCVTADRITEHFAYNHCVPWGEAINATSRSVCGQQSQKVKALGSWRTVRRCLTCENRELMGQKHLQLGKK